MAVMKLQLSASGLKRVVTVKALDFAHVISFFEYVAR